MFINQFVADPWREMDKILGNVDDLFFVRSPQKKKTVFPSTNMWGNEEKIVFQIEAPGIDIEKLNLNVVEDTLLIEGEKPNSEKDTTYHRKERKSGKFKRIFRLPYKIEMEKVEAKYQNGVLTITLPRAEADKPKKIKVISE